MFSEFEGEFEAVPTTGRASSQDMISLTHTKGKNKEEVVFRMSRRAMDKAGLKYKDKVEIQFAGDNSVCRIRLSSNEGAVTLSQQTANNKMSAGIIRLIFREGMPNFIEIENKSGKHEKVLSKTRYIHEENKIEYGNSRITFKLKLDTYK